MEPYTPVHEKISVEAKFSIGGKLEVTSFIWKDKEYTVSEVTFVSKAYRGRDTVWLVHVATHSAAFKLRFDTDTLNWWLEEFTWEEKE